MKKGLFLVSILCFVSISVLNAQFSKGNFLLGVSSSSNIYNLYSSYSGGSSNLMHLGFSTMKSKSDNGDGDSEKIRTFNISPRSGYFVADNLAVGLDLNVSFMSYGSGDDKETTTVLGFGPFARYYKPLDKCAPFVELGGSVGSLRNKYTSYLDNEETDKEAIWSYTVGLGLSVPLGEMIKFDMMAGYSSTTIKDKEDNPNNYREVLGTLGFKLGFLLYLGANK
ncbi:MAG TPA: outer membrane beta-barrel protein [Bacteroidales bacterium]|nr:outer membrane beta-barrel protein [Bacteroidales bacterium]